MSETEPKERTRGRAVAVVRAHPVQALGIAVIVLLGAFLRVWALGRQPINSDEAVVGLMAREILHGHFFAFYWGQDYGGGEPYVVSAVFTLFGQSSFTLGFTPVLLDAVSAVLLACIGRRLFSLRVGVIAALLFWLWPEVYLWQSTLEYGFRWVALICGLSVTLLSLRLLDEESSHRRLRWAALGLFAGIGWWSTPEIAYYLLPSALVFGWRLARKRMRLAVTEVLTTFCAFGLGALPWLWANVRSGFASLHGGVQPDPSFLSHMKALVQHALPILLGLQLPVPATASGRWLISASIGELLLLIVVAAGVFWIAVLTMSGRGSLLVWFVVTFPFLYALSPFTWFWYDDRYAVFFAPAAALLLASGAEELSRWLATRTSARRLVMAPCVVVLSLGLVLTGWAMDNRAPFVANHDASSPQETWTTWASNPNGYVARLAARLEASGQRDLYAGYWVSYVLDFESGGAITATDARYSRYPPYLQRVTSSVDPGWLFVVASRRSAAVPYFQSALLDPGCAAGNDRCLDSRQLELYLTAEKILYRSISEGDFIVVTPARPVLPEAVFRRFHIVPAAAGT